MFYPDGIPKKNEIYGKYEEYKGRLVIGIPIIKWGEGETEFILEYQGCQGDLSCFPPVTKIFSITSPDTTQSFNSNSVTKDSSIFSPSLSSTTNILENGNLLLVLGAFFVFGLLLSLTPCVLPMIPILLGLIVGQKETTKHKAFFLSLCYVLGMAITYAIAGVITAKIGNSVQSILQNAWVISACSIIFVLLALSLFGLYEIKLPSALLNKLNNTANKTKSGSYIGVFVMGIISSLIVSPCVSAPLAGTLIYIASTGNALIGGSALFALALGMGVLLIVAGTSGGKLLLKSGGWMQTIKYLLGIVMIALAIWMLERIIPSRWGNMLYGLLLIGSSIFIEAIKPVRQNNWKRFIKMIAFFVLVAGLGLVFSFFWPTASTPQSKPHQSTAKYTDKAFVFTKVTTFAEMKKLISMAKKEQKPVIIEYYADWCTICKEMEQTTFKDSRVRDSLKPFVTIKADVTKNDEDSRKMKEKYGVFAPPYIVFLDANGNEVRQMATAGKINADKLNQKLQKILSKHTR